MVEKASETRNITADIERTEKRRAAVPVTRQNTGACLLATSKACFAFRLEIEGSEWMKRGEAKNTSPHHQKYQVKYRDQLNRVIKAQSACRL